MFIFKTFGGQEMSNWKWSSFILCSRGTRIFLMNSIIWTNLWNKLDTKKKKKTMRVSCLMLKNSRISQIFNEIYKNRNLNSGNGKNQLILNIFNPVRTNDNFKCIMLSKKNIYIILLNYLIFCRLAAVYMINNEKKKLKNI